MQNQDVKNSIIELIAKQTGLDSETIELDWDLEEDLGLTQDDLTALIKKINHAYEDINLNSQDLTENSVNTVGKLTQLVSDELAFA